MNKLEATKDDDDVPDFLVTLSRLNLECNSVNNSVQMKRNDLTDRFSALPSCLRCAHE